MTILFLAVHMARNAKLRLWKSYVPPVIPGTLLALRQYVPLRFVTVVSQAKKSILVLWLRWFLVTP